MKNNFSKKKGFSDRVKDMFLDMVGNYAKREFITYFEKKIAKRIRYEVRKIVFSMISLILVMLGLVFLLYTAFDILITALDLPSFMTNFLFGSFLLIMGLIVFITRP